MNENDKECAGLAIKDSVLPVRDAADLPPLVLPRPMCTYADHSYPAFSKVQMTEFATAYARAALAQAAPASPPMGDDPLFDASSLLLRTAQDFWNAAKQARQYGAVQWVLGDDGALLIYTRGEYREQLMANIDKLGQAPHVFAAPASPASAPVASNLISACRELIAYVDANPPIADSLWCVQKIRAALAAPLPPVVARKVLTDEEIEQIVDAAKVKCVHPAAATTKDIARAIERHLMGESK